MIIFFTFPPSRLSYWVPLCSSPCSSSLPWRCLGRTLLCDELLWGPRGTELMLSLLSLSLALPCYHCCNSSLFVYHCLLRQHPNSPLSPSPHLRSPHMSLWDWQPPLRVRAGTDGIWMVHSCMKKVSGWRKWSKGTLNCELSMTKSHCNNYHFRLYAHILIHTDTTYRKRKSQIIYLFPYVFRMKHWKIKNTIWRLAAQHWPNFKQAAARVGIIWLALGSTHVTPTILTDDDAFLIIAEISATIFSVYMIINVNLKIFTVLP